MINKTIREIGEINEKIKNDIKYLPEDVRLKLFDIYGSLCIQKHKINQLEMMLLEKTDNEIDG